MVSGDEDRGPLLGALLRFSYEAVAAEIIREVAAAGYPEIQSSHFAVLRPLWDHPEGMRSTDLAATARITKQSMGAIVDQVEEHGYVERIDDPDDGRAKRIRLTSRGRKVGRMIRAVVRRVEADWERRIGAARFTTLREALIAIVATLDDQS